MERRVRIQIIGPSGSGKSTLAEYAAKRLGVTWIDTDRRYFWADENFRQETPNEERRRRYREDVETLESYIVSGSVLSWCGENFPDKDMLVLLKISDEVRLARIEERERARFGERILPGGDQYETSREFLEWCAAYGKDESINSQRSKQRAIFEMEGKRAVELWAEAPTEELFEEMMRKYREICGVF